MWLALWMVASAWSADRVLVHAGTAADAVGPAAADAGLAPWDLDPVRPEAVLTGDVPRAYGPDQPAPCTGEPLRNQDLVGATTEARTVVPAARDRLWLYLDGVRSRLGCLEEPAERSAVALFLLAVGSVAADRGDVAGARAAFADALSVKPDLQAELDSKATAAEFGRAVDAARAGGTGAVVAGAGVDATGLLLDGVPLEDPDQVPHGFHLLQGGSGSRWTVAVRVTDLPVVVAVPAAVDDAYLARAAEQAVGAALEPLLAPLGDGVLVWTGARTVEVGGAVLPPSPLREAELHRKRAHRRRGAGTALLAVGGPLAVGGWVAYGLAGSPTDWHRAEGAARLQQKGAGVAAGIAGVVSSGTGAVLFLSGR